MSKRLRGLWTRIMFGSAPCIVCGRERFYPGALQADVCERHYHERVARKLIDALTAENDRRLAAVRSLAGKWATEDAAYDCDCSRYHARAILAVLDSGDEGEPQHVRDCLAGPACHWRTSKTLPRGCAEKCAYNPAPGPLESRRDD